MGNKVRLLVVLFVLLAWQASAAGSLTVESNFTTAQATAADLDRGYLDYPLQTGSPSLQKNTVEAVQEQTRDYFSAPHLEATCAKYDLCGALIPFSGTEHFDELVAEGGRYNPADVDYRIKLSWLIHLITMDNFDLYLNFRLSLQGD